MKVKVISALTIIAILVILSILGPWALFSLATIAIFLSLYEITSAKFIEPATNVQVHIVKPKSIRIFAIVMSMIMIYWDYIVNAVYYLSKNEVVGVDSLIFRGFISLPTLGVAIMIMILFAEVLIRKDFSVFDLTFVFTMTMFLTLAGQSLLYMCLYNSQLDALKRVILPVFVLTVTAMTDGGSYFVGIKFGKTKLNPRISPNKTIEGLIGGVLTGIFFTSLFAFIPLLAIPNYNWAMTMVIGTILSITTPFGDLVFSAIKRFYQIKDYSHLIPGHGGVLDRIDSMLINVVIFAIIDNTFIKFASDPNYLYRFIFDLFSRR
jgi:phosphatidate cytidylyltransferase